MSKQIEIVKQYIALVESLDQDRQKFMSLLCEDYTQWELPNLLNKTG